MKLSAITISVISIFLFGMMLASATSELSGGMDVVVNNGGSISGVARPGSTSISLADNAFTRDFNVGEDQEFDALFANDDNTLGTASATRYSWFGGFFGPTTKTKDPSKSYALLSFKAPDAPIDIQLLKSTIPASTITADQFTQSVTNAGGTWNNNGVVSKQFFGTVKDALSTTKAQANDKNFVQSFAKSSQSWIACSWLTSSSNKLTDWDVIYNTRYTFSTNPSLTQNANLRYVDLQAVALHEMGHAVGLDDIYNKPALSWDTDEVMNSYIWGKPRYTFGPGDLSGLKAKYGS